MANAVNADPNTWYYINNTHFDGQNLAAAYRTKAGQTSSPVFTQEINNTRAEQKWQFFPYNGATIVRALSTGPTTFLFAFLDPTQAWFGTTSVEMRNISAIDPTTDWNTSSLLWDIKPWNNEEFNMANRANHSDWFFDIKDNAFTVMDNNSTGPRNGQRFSLVEAGKINNPVWSTVSLPGTSTTATAPLGSSTFTSPPPESSSTDSGLSTGAKAGIGVGVGVAALAALILGVFLFLRQRKRKAAYSPAAMEEAGPREEKPPLYGSPGQDVVEAPSNGYYAPQEVEGSSPGATVAPKFRQVNETPVELPSDR